MDDAVDAGLVSEIADRADGYRFSHPLVAEVLARALSAARRARLHHRAGVTLAARGDAAPAGDVTSHLVAAGHLADPLTTATQAERAGAAAMAQFA